jgi:hypothetical protein
MKQMKTQVLNLKKLKTQIPIEYLTLINKSDRQEHVQCPLWLREMEVLQEEEEDEDIGKCVHGRKMERAMCMFLDYNKEKMYH